MRDCFCGGPRSRPPTPRHAALAAGQRPSSAMCTRQPSAPPPGYHTALKKDPVGKLGFRDNGVVGAAGDASHEAVVVLGVTAGVAPQGRQRCDERVCSSGVRPCDIGHGLGHLIRDNLADSGRESFCDESSSRELERLRRHLKLAQQQLDLAYQAEEGSPSRSSSPESNGTAVEQNRLNFGMDG
ncbi:hypothetical protein CRUP_015184 [Coryphaenoides rupestris]|nr:hypothetical protein CRUP_015184 [Coryphaenoides rupestris]